MPLRRLASLAILRDRRPVRRRYGWTDAHVRAAVPRVLWAKCIGSILGVFTAMHSTGMALGGYLGGLLHDRFDGYS
jgi:hypothetical protein